MKKKRAVLKNERDRMKGVAEKKVKNAVSDEDLEVVRAMAYEMVLKEAGVVTKEDINKFVKDITESMETRLDKLRRKRSVDPMEVFDIAKDAKEALDAYVLKSEDVLWEQELKAMLKGQPVRVREFQRMSLECKRARFEFVKQLQSILDDGKDLLKKYGN